MNNILNWKETNAVDNSIEKINEYEYEPHQGTRLNDVGDIRITITNEDQFIHPSQSVLYIEGELVPLRNNNQFDNNDAGITLVNNGLMYLFNRMDYSISNKKIEGFNNPGRATTMKGLLTYPHSYPEGMSFFWIVDKTSGIDNNKGFETRCNQIHKYGEGKFTAIIPLSHIFGFCENYDKVMYGAKHELTLHRTSDNDAIYKTSEKTGTDPNITDKVKRGQINLTKISWRMPIIKLSDESKIELYNDIQKKVTIPIEFLSRQCESIQLNSGQKQLDWRLNVSSGSERPRYIILGFQANKHDNQESNASIFDHLDVCNTHIEFNGNRYPENEMNLNFNGNNYITAYKMTTDFYNNVMGKESCSIRFRDFKTHHPLFVFDISRQDERMKDTTSDIRIKTQFNTNIPVDSFAYALILSDREINIRSDGDRMHVIM